MLKQSISVIIFCILVLGLYACNSSLKDFATNWTKEIKQKIISDASQHPDKRIFDSISYTLTLYKGSTKLKQFLLRPKFDTTYGKIITLDTLVEILYSTDQNFELVRELCPAVERSFEGINYKGIGSVGLIEFKFCDGSIKERGFRYANKPVGIWEMYDSTGKLIEEKDNGNSEALDKLHEIKYSRVSQLPSN